MEAAGLGWAGLGWAGLRLALVWVKQQQYNNIGVTNTSVSAERANNFMIIHLSNYLKNGTNARVVWRKIRFRYVCRIVDNDSTTMNGNKCASSENLVGCWLWNVGKLKKKISVYCLMVVKGFKLELH